MKQKFVVKKKEKEKRNGARLVPTMGPMWNVAVGSSFELRCSILY